MNFQRNYRQVIYGDGSIETFDPLLRWCLQTFSPGVIGELGVRGDWALGFMWRYRIGAYSVYRTKFLVLGRLTLYAHLGRRGPHNPRTGAVYDA